MDELVQTQLAQYRKLEIKFIDGIPFTDAELGFLGCHIVSLDISVGYSIPHKSVYDLLAAFTSHIPFDSRLQELKLNYIYMNKEHVKFLIKMAKKLTKIDFSFCNLTDELMEPFFLECSNLKEITVLGNYEFGGSSFKCLQNMLKMTIERPVTWKLDLNDMKANNPELCWIIYSIGRANVSLRDFKTEALN